MGTGSFPGVKYGRGVLTTTHPLIVPWSWKSRAIPLPTLWATTGPVTGTLYLILLIKVTYFGHLLSSWDFKIEILGEFILFFATDFVFDSTKIPEQYSKQQPLHLFTVGLSFTISTSLCPFLAVALSVCAYIREMPDLLSARIRHIFQSNAVTILLWRQHHLLPIPSQVSYFDHLDINTVPSTVLTLSATSPENEVWKQRKIENYSWQAILGPLMTNVFVDEMVSCFVKYSWINL
jgi:hypothetical protein